MVWLNCCLSFFVVSHSSSLQPSTSRWGHPLMCAANFATYLTTHPDRGKVAYLVEGLHQGFHVCVIHNTKLKSAKWNKPSALILAKVVDKYLAKEVSRGGYVAGPFPSPPLQLLHIISFVVIPKKGQLGKWRLR